MLSPSCSWLILSASMHGLGDKFVLLIIQKPKILIVLLYSFVKFLKL